MDARKIGVSVELISNIEELVIMLKRASETASQLQREIEEINNFKLEIGTRNVKA